MYVYVNGEIVEASHARLSVFDHGFMYGLGLFETFRIYNGHPFLIDDHFKRMEKGLQLMNISWEYNRKRVTDQLYSLLEANQCKNAYVRYNIAAGEGSLGLSTEQYCSPTVIIYMKPLPPAAESFFPEKKGRILSVRRNTPEAAIRLKSHHFFNNILGKQEAGEDPSVEGLFLTEEGELAEGVVSNLFWRKGNTIYTPSLDTGILDGVTRSFVIKLAKRASFQIMEGRYSPSCLYKADEAFVTNSIQEIVRILSINNYEFINEQKDSVVNFLQREYVKYRMKLWHSTELFE